MKRVCVVGGGLGGVTIASLLHKRKDVKLTVYESSDKINGRLGLRLLITFVSNL